jgi:hypothetical protein
MPKEARGDRAAQKARAQSIRERIRELKGSGGRTAGGSKDEAERQPSKSESPREFIERRMRELDKKGKDQ